MFSENAENREDAFAAVFWSAAPPGAALSKDPLKDYDVAESLSGSRIKSVKEFFSSKERKGRRETMDSTQILPGAYASQYIVL